MSLAKGVEDMSGEPGDDERLIKATQFSRDELVKTLLYPLGIAVVHSSQALVLSKRKKIIGARILNEADRHVPRIISEGYMIMFCFPGVHGVC